MIFGSVWPLGWEGLFLYTFASLRGRWRGDMCRRAVCNVVGRLGDGVRKHVRADAAQRWLLLSVSELWAGAALSLAGFGSGRSVGARGGDNGDCPAWRWSSIAAFCARLMSAVQFYRNVLRSITHIVAVLLGRFAFGLRLLFDVNAKQDGLRYVSFLFRGGRERHSCVLAAVLGYLALLVHFGIGRFFIAIPTEYDRSPFIRKEAPYRVALLSLWRACSL